MIKSTSGIEDARVHPRLYNTINVAAMDTDSDTHEHMLWSLSNASVDPQEVGSLERLEPEAIHNNTSVPRRKVKAITENTTHKL